jgi:hypothetical protein
MVPSENSPPELSSVSVGFDNLKFFGQFQCPTLGDRNPPSVLEVLIERYPLGRGEVTLIRNGQFGTQL